MNRPIWLEPDGSIKERAPFWVYEDMRQWERGDHRAHSDLYYRRFAENRSRLFHAELAVHGNYRDTMACLRNFGCISKTTIFRDEYLADLEYIRAEAQERAQRAGAVPVTPPLCLMGETQPPKSLKICADIWRQNNAS